MEVLGKMRYQYPTDVYATTMGPCPECDKLSRGSSKCGHCLADDMAEIIQDRKCPVKEAESLAVVIHISIREQSRLVDKALSKIRGETDESD